MFAEPDIQPSDIESSPRIISARLDPSAMSPICAGSVSRRLRAPVADVHPRANEADASGDPDIDRQAGQKNSAARRVGRYSGSVVHIFHARRDRNLYDPDLVLDVQ